MGRWVTRRVPGASGVVLVALALTACGGGSTPHASPTSSGSGAQSHACSGKASSEPTHVYGVGTTVLTHDATGRGFLVRTTKPVIKTDPWADNARVAVVTVMLGTTDSGSTFVDNSFFGMQAGHGECFMATTGQVPAELGTPGATLEGKSTASFEIAYQVGKGTAPEDLVFLVYPGPSRGEPVGFKIGEHVPADTVS